MIALDLEHRATRHYFDRELGISAVKLLPGEYYITTENMMLTTVLGSCVSACVRDSTAGVGGMNHFMLPDANPNSRETATAMRYGSYAMELLLSELFKAGARRDRLEAKVFGGGAVLANMSMLNIGDRNADFVLHHLHMAQVRLAAQDLRGKLPRRVNYFPGTGKVTVRKLRRQDDTLMVQREEQELLQALLKQRGLRKLELGSGRLPPGFANRPATI